MPPDDVEEIWREIRDLRRALTNHTSNIARALSGVHERLAGIETTLEHVPRKKDLVALKGEVKKQAADWEKVWELFKLPVAAAIGAAMPAIIEAIKSLFK